MLRRLHPDQPESFAFTPANEAWARAQIAKYPPGRQASAIIPLLWRAQEQEGWLTRAAIEHVADMLGMPYIRALEVATFYFMFQLAPVGSVAHVQVCGTTSCMISGAEDLIAVCRRRIAPAPHQCSADGRFSWEEVECLGACANAPMVQIGKDYYEDLTPERLEWILDELAAGRVPVPGPQGGRFASEPAGGPVTLAPERRVEATNASVALALALGDTVKRIDGTEAPSRTPRRGGAAAAAAAGPSAGAGAAAPAAEPAAARPPGLAAPRGGAPDDLTRIKGIGPKLAALLHDLGIFHFDQIAAWTPAELAWIDAHLEGFRGRATRDGWVAQAQALAGPRAG
jgi:NADH-quinone oxidoreductase subunit E